MKHDKKNKRWTRWRHRVVRNILSITLGPYTKLKYHIKVERFKQQEKRPYLILMNHQTAFDQFFVGLAFKGPVYYLASEDLFSNGWVSSLIKYLVEPIPIKKQTTDIRAVLNCMRVAKEGGTIAIAPEGNRTYSGRTEYMNPSIAQLARKLGVPVALFRIEGGYGVQPRWSDVVRRGKMRAYVSRVITPEEISAYTDAELFDAIKEGLYVNEATPDGEFRHKRCAEYMERAIYVCPRCGLSSFESSRDVIKCNKCGGSVRYTETKELLDIDLGIPFRFVADWYDYQSSFINVLDVEALCDGALYEEAVAVSEVIPYKKKLRISKDATIRLYGNRAELSVNGENLILSFDEATAVTVLGRNKLNIYHGGKIYQFKGSKRFNALKYVHMYHRYKNIRKGDQNVEFLGL